MSRGSGSGAALAWCPYPDIEAAREAAKTMLEERLIACANILPAIESVFEWEGQADSATEVAVLFKTDADRLEHLVTRLAECHPYDTPAIFGWRCDAVAEPTAAWLESVLNKT